MNEGAVLDDATEEQDDASPAAPVDAAPPNVDWLMTARHAYSGSEAFFDSSLRSNIINDLKQFQGVHPTGSKYHSDPYRTRSRLFRPKTRATIRKNEASASEAFFSSVDVVSVTAENDGTDMNVAASKLFQALLQYRLTKSIPWFQILMGAYQEAQSLGVVSAYIDWEFDERRKPKPIDRPRIKLLPVENLRLDPACDWTDPINTSPYTIELMPMYVKDVKSRIAAGKWAPVDAGELLSASGKTVDTIRAVREGQRQDSKGQQTAITDFTIVWVHRNIIEMDGQDWLFYTLGTTRMLSKPIPLEQAYFSGERPYVMGCIALEAHKTYPGGISRLTRDMQAEINELANSRQDNVKFVLQKRYHVKRNVQVDVRSLTRNIPGSVTMMNDPETDVKVVDTPDVTASSYKENDLMNVEFDDVAGSFSTTSVQSNKNLNETVGGMDMLDAKANAVGNYMLRTFAITFAEPVLRKLIKLEAHYEDDEIVLGLAAKNAKLMEQFKIDAVTDALLMQDVIVDVNVGQGSTSPEGKLKNLVGGITSLKAILEDGVLENHGLKVGELISEVLGIIGYKNSERFFSVDEDPTITALRAQLQKTQTALDSKFPPDLMEAQIAKLRAEVANTMALAVQNGVKAAFAAVQTGQVIAQMPAIAPVADAIMKSAGYQTPDPVGDDPQIPTADGQVTHAGDALPTLPAPIPGAAGPVDTGAPPGGASTDPESPALPASPDTGFNQGIETPQSDSGA